MECGNFLGFLLGARDDNNFMVLIVQDVRCTLIAIVARQFCSGGAFILVVCKIYNIINFCICFSHIE